MLCLVVAALVVTLDQLSKHAVTEALGADPLHGPSLLDGWLVLTYTTNTGGAFGILADRGPLFIAVGTGLVAALILWWPLLARQSLIIRASLGLLLGGACGNLIDRARLGHVVDFIQVKSWPVFNLADSAIVLGMGLLLLFGVASSSSTQE